MIFGRRGVVVRSGFFHQLTIYAIAWLQQWVLAIDSFYRSVAIHQRLKPYRRMRNGRLGRWLPSVGRLIDGMARIVDRLIVAQGLPPEKMIVHSGSANSGRGLAFIGQLVLACSLVLLIWIYWPNSASAPIDVNRTQTAVNSVLVAEAGSVGNSTNNVSPSTQELAEEITAAEAAVAETVIVDSILAQVTSNSAQDVEDADPLVEGRTFPLQVDEVAPILREFAALETEDDPALIGDGVNAASVEEERIVQLQSILEAAIRDAMRTDPSKETEEAGTLVVVEPQIQPSTANAVNPAERAVADGFPSALVLGSAWETFTPQPAAEIDHYWLDWAFPPGYSQFYSPNYQFGSTAGGRYRPHHGVDISNPAGSPVIAMAAGEVIHAGPDNPTLLGPYNNFYGNSVVILLDRKLATPDGEKDVYLLYGHLSEVHASRGQQINVGDAVGAVGMTGIAIGPHLHVEVRVGQNSYMTAVNPALWIRPLPGTGTVAVRLLNVEGRSWVGAKVSLLKYEGEGARWVRTIETYRNEERLRSNPLWGENGALSNLDAGNYYIAAEINGEKVGQNITVQAGSTTFVELRTKQ
ncbi:MAG: M23 family metallopeptidase [Caldilineaceae bacterium]|nr:M23 family metallopeptidase [Caldilineaceae bacterium]